MTPATHDSVLPDEDAFVFPDDWRKHLHPRRGGAPGPSVRLEKKALAATDARVALARKYWLDEELAQANGDTEIVGQLRRTLAGEPTPTGAAVLSRCTVIRTDRELAEFADAWTLRHGVAFAAVAAVRSGMIVYGEGRRPHFDASAAGYRIPPNLVLLRRIRTLLAAAAEDEYAEAVAMLGQEWSCCVGCRAVIAYLVPTQTEWVDESCDAYRNRQGSGMDRNWETLVHCALGTAEQAALLRAHTKQWTYYPDMERWVTMVDGLGPAAAPLLTGHFEGNPLAKTVRALASVLASLPSDEAMRTLIERRDDQNLGSAIRESVDRFPVRGVRLLAAAAAQCAPGSKKAATDRELLQRHVLAHREAAAAALAELSGPSAAIVEELLPQAAALPTAPAKLLPRLLVEPQWSRQVEPKPSAARPEVPDWLAPASLPQVLLRGGEFALPDSARMHLLEALAGSTLQKPCSGLPDVVEALDAPSLAEFGWQVFSAWRSVGHPPRQAWTLTALGIVGGDETVTRLVPVIKAWPGESGHHRAVAGLEVLAAVGTDHALRCLDEIARRVKFTALRQRAGEKVAAIAAARGLTGEQLADRLVPDLGLDADGGLWLDFGPRGFRVGFDEQLTPFVTDQAGARRKALPVTNAKDDVELAAAARMRFTALKKEARAVAADQIRRLEQAMVDQRPWTAAEFTGLLLAHPLLRHVVRRLLWVGELEGVRTAFRVAEDLTFADVDDAVFVLPAASTVRLAHPLNHPQGLAAWAEIFADYEIMQPFAQLGRPVYELTDAEKASHRLERFAGKKVPIGRILGLTKDGWLRSPAMDNGIENCITKRLDASVYLVIDLDRGIPVGYVGEETAAEQTLTAVYLSPKAEVYQAGSRDSGLRFADLDPLTASELLGRLTRLVD